MKQRLRVTLLLILSLLLLTTTAFADMGPKSQLIVRVKNGPNEPYYLDILAQSQKHHSMRSNLNREELSELDSALLEALITAIPEGWHGCVSQGTEGAPIFGKLTAREDGTHHFSYHGVPWTYRILMVTESGEVFLSDVQERTVLQSSATVDWAAKNLSTPPTWVGYVLQFLATLLPTLLVEGLLLLAFGLWNPKNKKVFLLVNLITQGLLALFFSVSAIKNGVNFLYLLLLLPAEIVILCIELVVYRRCLTDCTRAKASAYAALANVCSAVLGYLFMEPVWRFVVSIS